MLEQALKHTGQPVVPLIPVVATGNHIVGTFLGGTGRYAGVTGEYSFEWEYIVESEDGTVSGRAVDLRGRARLGSVAAAHDGEHSQ